MPEVRACSPPMPPSWEAANSRSFHPSPCPHSISFYLLTGATTIPSTCWATPCPSGADREKGAARAPHHSHRTGVETVARVLRYSDGAHVGSDQRRRSCATGGTNWLSGSRKTFIGNDYPQNRCRRREIKPPQ